MSRGPFPVTDSESGISFSHLSLRYPPYVQFVGGFSARPSPPNDLFLSVPLVPNVSSGRFITPFLFCPRISIVLLLFVCVESSLIFSDNLRSSDEGDRASNSVIPCTIRYPSSRLKVCLNPSLFSFFISTVFFLVSSGVLLTFNSRQELQSFQQRPSPASIRPVSLPSSSLGNGGLNCPSPPSSRIAFELCHFEVCAAQRHKVAQVEREALLFLSLLRFVSKVLVPSFLFYRLCSLVVRYGTFCRLRYLR